MINMYNFKGHKIPSKEYVDDMIKQTVESVSAALLKSTMPIKVVNIEKHIKDHSVDVPLNVESGSIKITADMIKTDPENSFISKRTLKSLKERPTKFEVSEMITKIEERISRDIAAKFDKLLNTPDALNKIKDIITILKQDDVLTGFTEVISGKVDSDTFTKHIDSIKHLDNNDRKALNLLIELWKSGFADWNAGEKDPNYIRNKPTALPACGGNADTLEGYYASDLISKRTEDLIVGIENSTYSTDEVDMVVMGDYSNIKDIKQSIDEIFCKGIISFRNGIYYLDEWEINPNNKDDSYTTIISGSGGNNTIFLSSKITAKNNIEFKDIYFKKCSVIMNKNIKFKDCIFEDCEIILSESNKIIIKDSEFNNSKFIFTGTCNNVLIWHNILSNTESPKYIGSNIKIEDNIIMR